MENYIVSARKYRPATFDSVVGQSALTTTLKNAISTGKLAHAYLFCGPRGVGKTTCARIFARTINCSSPTKEGEACGECESCRAFNEQRSYSIHELDAASNNSVEDIRSLIEQVRIPPQVGKYKVFIIDEVHMLSVAAFNAFLKTLEEPPAHAIFILATTEKHKILPTILSRCQIYDFNRMEVSDIVSHLKGVAMKEGYSVEDEALGVIAQKADGGMRDALSIFDQVASFSGGKITYQVVIENLNVLDYDYYFKLTDQLLRVDIPGALVTFNEILKRGFEANFFMGGLASHFRDLLVSKDASTLPLLEVADSVKKRYMEQTAKCKPEFLYRALKLCNDCDINYRTSRNKRLLVELTLIEVAQASSDDVPSSGRSPKNVLKPIFDTVAQNVQPEKSKENVTASVVSTAITANKPAGSQLHPVSVTQQNQTKVNPSVKRPQTISLRITQQVVEQEQKNDVVSEKQSKVIENKAFDEEKLQYFWRCYASSLPVEQNANAARMKNMKPQLGENFMAVVLVENDLVKEIFEKMKFDITAYLREKLENSQFTLVFRTMERTELKKVYSKKEQFEAMQSSCSALNKLKEALGLELT